jgi:hypothetical protein
MSSKPKKSGISKPKPPVGLEFELTTPFLEANPDVKEAMPVAPSEPVALPSGTLEIHPVVPVSDDQVQQILESGQRRICQPPPLNIEILRKRELEAFLWGAASALLVCGTVGFLIWTLSTAPSLPPPGPA